MMPFRIPDRYRSTSVRSVDPDRDGGGDLKDYIRWLRKELKLAEIALAERKKEETAEAKQTLADAQVGNEQ
jgi:hypothetical protein